MKELFDFKIGDRVEVVRASDIGATNSHVGYTGVVVHIRRADGVIGVEFDQEIHDEGGWLFGHTCGGHAQNGHGWYCGVNDLAPEMTGIPCSVDDLL